ncbi:MAG: large conductance mechanosensitive channel protein MscL [Ruminococcaceae bacterium]|nr:large conductance mechanosensitive channel protein MscL [Oscillospiraceae bacterium]
MSLKKKGKGFVAEFRDFIMRGNVIDMAVGVIVATAFGKITTSLVNDVIMPFIGWLIGDIDLSKVNIVLVEEVLNEAGEVLEPAVVIGIGTLLVTIIDFLIIAFIVFLIIKIMAKAKELAEAKKAKEEPAPEAPKGPTTEELLAQILEEIKKDKE